MKTKTKTNQNKKSNGENYPVKKRSTFDLYFTKKKGGERTKNKKLVLIHMDFVFNVNDLLHIRPSERRY